MLPFHDRLARVGLAATEGFGFVLAGGYALSANEVGDRPSADVDLFTNDMAAGRFAEAVHRLVEALSEDGLTITITRQGPTFLDVMARDEDTGEASAIQLGINYREFPPKRLNIGPVLDLRDAVASKMSALWSRGEVRDFVDVDAVRLSGRFTDQEILELADRQEASPMDRRRLADRFRLAATGSVADYGLYDVDPARRAAIIDRFARWADDIAADG